jgi:hypothetical protein
MFVLPLRNTTKTLRAPHRSAEVAQSNAVSPAPNTITLPLSSGNFGPDALQAHKPGLLPSATNGKKSFDVRNPLLWLSPLKISSIFGSGNPMPKNIAAAPPSRRP